MSHSALELPLAGAPVFDEMVATYNATTLARIDRAQLRAWRPQPGLWNRIKPLVAMQAGARLRTAEVDGHALHYWDIGDASKSAQMNGRGSS